MAAGASFIDIRAGRHDSHANARAGRSRRARNATGRVRDRCVPRHRTNPERRRIPEDIHYEASAPGHAFERFPHVIEADTRAS